MMRVSFLRKQTTYLSPLSGTLLSSNHKETPLLERPKERCVLEIVLGKKQPTAVPWAAKSTQYATISNYIKFEYGHVCGRAPLSRPGPFHV
jgi:hypothetical protein